MLQAVLFDMGGTLLRRPTDRGALARAGDDALWAALRDHYPTLTLPAPAAFHEIIQDLLQHPAAQVDRREDVLARLAAAQGWPLAAHDDALLTAWHRPLLESGTTEPDLRATLDTLRAQGLRLGVISNTDWRAPYRDRELARAGIIDLFPVRIYSADLGIEKPDPRIFAAGLAALGGVHPRHALYVGDHLHGDIGGAQRAGLWAAWLAVPGTPAAPAGAPQPDLIIRALRDLPARLAASRLTPLHPTPSD